MKPFECECYFCVNGLGHPSHHKDFEPTTHVLLKAESLDPKDSVPMVFCTMCGHQQPAEGPR